MVDVDEIFMRGAPLTGKQQRAIRQLYDEYYSTAHATAEHLSRLGVAEVHIRRILWQLHTNMLAAQDAVRNQAYETKARKP